MSDGKAEAVNPEFGKVVIGVPGKWRQATPGEAEWLRMATGCPDECGLMAPANILIVEREGQ